MDRPDSEVFLDAIELGIEVARQHNSPEVEDFDRFTAYCVWQELRRAGWSIVRTPA